MTSKTIASPEIIPPFEAIPLITAELISLLEALIVPLTASINTVFVLPSPIIAFKAAVKFNVTTVVPAAIKPPALIEPTFNLINSLFLL